jgi:hypothetical protein
MNIVIELSEPETDFLALLLNEISCSRKFFRDSDQREHLEKIRQKLYTSIKIWAEKKYEGVYPPTLTPWIAK